MLSISNAQQFAVPQPSTVRVISRLEPSVDINVDMIPKHFVNETPQNLAECRNWHLLEESIPI